LPKKLGRDYRQRHGPCGSFPPITGSSLDILDDRDGAGMLLATSGDIIAQFGGQCSHMSPQV